MSDVKYNDVSEEMSEKIKHGDIITRLLKISNGEKSKYWQTDRYLMTCKICGFSISDMSAEIMASNTRSHVMSHKTSSRAFGDNYYSYSTKGLYAVTPPEDVSDVDLKQLHLRPAAIYVRIDHVVELAPQHLLINPSQGTLKEFHRQIYAEYKYSLADNDQGYKIEFPHVMPQYTWAEYDSDYTDVYLQAMMGWDYVCTACGEEYESGLPSIEMVLLHTENCSAVNGKK